MFQHFFHFLFVSFFINLRFYSSLLDQAFSNYTGNKTIMTVHKLIILKNKKTKIVALFCFCLHWVLGTLLVLCARTCVVTATKKKRNTSPDQTNEMNPETFIVFGRASH